MAIKASNDFLRFSAYSIKDLITRKLSEDKNFTDQVYEGSNLAILIDIVSYMYQCLIYNLNNAAAESMFSDTQIYQNISRLCKFIGYHPTGYKPSTVSMYISQNSELNDKIIYPFTAIDTGLYDSNSNKIYFSTAFQNFTPAFERSNISINNEKTTNVTLVNGRWKHYATVFEAAGLDYETFVLDGLKSDSADEKYVANNGIQVFVIPNGVALTDVSQNEIMWSNDPNELFIQAYDSNSESPTFSKLYSNDDKVYTAYLNENKTFEIKFGNGITGRRLNKGDQIHVMYLDTNGPDGYVDMNSFPQQLNGRIMHHDPGFFGVSDDLYKAMFDTDPENSRNAANVDVSISFNPQSLSRVFPEQNVDDIREMAPNWFKTGNRLITKEDYEFFLKANNGNAAFPGVIDAVCMNNWDYMTTFYRWLYNLGINPVEEVLNSELHSTEYTKRTLDPFRYLSKARLVQSGYEFVDSADANNIYLWVATNEHKDMTIIKEQLNREINTIKTMTSETYPLYPIDVYFDLTFTPTQLYYDSLVTNNGNCEFDYNNSYLEVTIADNSIFSNIVIANKIESIIKNAFRAEYCHIGQIVDYSTILDQIYEINGVSRVRTVYYPTNYLEDENYQKYKTRACDGIAFASWSNTKLDDSTTSLIDIGDDLCINNTTRTLEKFQFPRLAPELDLTKKIKVIRKSMNTVNPVKF